MFTVPNRANRRPTRSAVTIRRPDAEVWRRALRLAGGDARRLEVLADNSVIVRNERVR
jgi:hypothetical protein